MFSQEVHKHKNCVVRCPYEEIILKLFIVVLERYHQIRFYLFTSAHSANLFDKFTGVLFPRFISKNQWEAQEFLGQDIHILYTITTPSAMYRTQQIDVTKQHVILVIKLFFILSTSILPLGLPEHMRPFVKVQ